MKEHFIREEIKKLLVVFVLNISLIIVISLTFFITKLEIKKELVWPLTIFILVFIIYTVLMLRYITFLKTR